MSLCKDGESYFHASLRYLIKSWTALQIAVQHGFGGIDGPAKVTWMVDATEQWFKENDELQPWEVGDFLTEVIDNEFDTVIDDGSLAKIAEEICQYYRLCKEGKQHELESRVQKLQPCDVAVRESVCQKEKEDESDEEMDVSTSDDMAPPLVPADRLSASQVTCSSNEVSNLENSTSTSQTNGMSEEERDMNTAVSEAAIGNEDNEWTVVHRKGKRK